MDREFLSGIGISDENIDLILEKSNAELNGVKIRHEVSNALSKRGVKSLDAAMKLFDCDGISVEDGAFLGIDEKIEEFVKNNDFLFNQESKPVFSAPSGNGRKNTLTREEFSKMGYAKRLKLFNENPHLYKELAGNE